MPQRGERALGGFGDGVVAVEALLAVFQQQRQGGDGALVAELIERQHRAAPHHHIRRAQKAEQIVKVIFAQARQAERRPDDHLRILVRQQRAQGWQRARIADFAERVRRRAAHADVLVAQRGDQRLDGGGVLRLAEQVGDELADLHIGRFEQVNRAFNIGGDIHNEATLHK